MTESIPGGIAIVGIGCRFPGGADSPSSFWQNLCDGVDAIVEVPPERFDLEEVFDDDPGRAGKLYTRWGGFIDGIDRFDPGFFGISPREASRIDPQQRLLLEVSWEALEDGGMSSDRFVGSNTGVFVGISTHDYHELQIGPAHRRDIDAHSSTGSATSIAANRISYAYDLRGPSLAIDTACSSSLTAVHLACRSLLGGECELAIAGGVNAYLNPETAIGFSRASMLSPDGRCKAFDASANGFVRAEGAGAVVLKPLAKALEDGDRVYAVVRGSAVNQDGRTSGITVPSQTAQEELIRHTLEAAGVEPAQIQYVEAHGTGTRVGDPIEASALGNVLGRGRSDEPPCLIGSVKTNIGHLEAGAGIAGLIKAALALERRVIPPSLHFHEPNPEIPFDELKLSVVTDMRPWPEGAARRLAGVNSFGFGGANAHVVLEGPPSGPAAEPVAAEHSAYLLPVSARHPEALRELLSSYEELLRAPEPPPLADLSYSAAVRRGHHPHRVAVVAENQEEAAEQIAGLLRRTTADSSATARAGAGAKTAFVFSGMGPQWWAMGRQLLVEEPVFREVIEDCDRRFGAVSDWGMLDELLADEEASRVQRADIAPAANAVLQLALVELWRSWGVVPDAIVGHSAGEFGAACAAGALSLDDALLVGFHRGRLQYQASGLGTMLSAGVSEEEALELIDAAGVAERVGVGAVNSPQSVTLSGPREDLEPIAQELERRERFQRFLPVEVPYHSPVMDPLRDDLLSSLQPLRPRVPEVPLVSTVTGTWVEEASHDPDYWFANLRQPVRFVQAIDALIEDGFETFVEIGPHPVLSVSVSECLAARERSGSVFPSLRRKEGERRAMLRTLAGLYERGCRLDWAGVCPSGKLVELPSYPWQKQRYWFEPDADSGFPAGVDTGRPLLGFRLGSVRACWESDLGQDELEFLDGHVVHHSPVCPAAAYLEMALAAAAEVVAEGAPVVEDVSFSKALFLTERPGVRLQLVHDAPRSSFEIFSRQPGAEDWELHAAGRLSWRPTGGEVGSPDLAGARSRCVTGVSVDGVYDDLAAIGLRYQGAFRGMVELSRGDGESLAHVVLPDDHRDDAGHFRLHPALLDSAFQALLAATADRPAGLYLPTAVRQLKLLREPGSSCWAHARLEAVSEKEIEGAIDLYTESGELAVTIVGFRCTSLEAGAKERAGLDDLLYDLSWEPKDLPAVVSFEDKPILQAGELADVLRPWADRQASLSGLDAVLGAFPMIEEAAEHFALAGLLELGWSGEGSSEGTVEALADRFGVAPEQRRLFARLLEIVGDTGEGDVPSEREAAFGLLDRVLETFEGSEALVRLLRHCGTHLAGLLTGRVDAREVLFGPEIAAVWAGFFAEFSGYAFYNDLIAEAIVRAAQNVPEDAPLRVLEIGAGTAGTTVPVLERLSGRTVEYCFTDLSAMFLAQARDRFRDQPWVEVKSLDIEADPLSQVGGRPFDVVLAANVLHATADLRKSLGHVRAALAPGGLLVLMEIVRKMAWSDLVFGVTEGWWRFTDVDLRPSHSSLRPDRWAALLADEGLEAATWVSPEPAGEEINAVVLASKPATQEAAEPASTGRRWLIVGDVGGVGGRIAAVLESKGDACDVLTADAVASRSPGEHLARSLEASEPEYTGLLHTRSLDAPGPEVLTATSAVSAPGAVCSDLIEVLQVLEESGRPLPPLWLVTAGAQAVADRGDGPNVAQAPLWGLARVLSSEYPQVPCRTVDLGAACSDEDVDALLRELEAETDEEEIALRDGKRFVSRLRRVRLGRTESSHKSIVSPQETAFRLDVDNPGALESLTLRQLREREPGPGEVSIRVIAAGMNFRDVMLALGMLPPMDVPGSNGRTVLGFECSGVVDACGEGVEGLGPGDEVMAVAVGAFASRVVTRAEMTVPKPEGFSFEEAAGVPLAFVTAHYGLTHLAQLRAGERVLIHAATGGVGLAAIQLARRAGAEIFATAGSPEKRDLLRDLGIDRVMDSRSLAFADQVMEATDGEGVDVVLNSLAGEAIAKGLSVLAPYGRFVELGKRDIYADSPIGLLPFDRNLSFSSVALDRMCLDRPQQVGAMLREVVDMMREGALQALPCESYDLADAEAAFRFLAQARHIGKLVLTVTEDSYSAAPCAERDLFHADATYLITGGLGGVGLLVARWMVDSGARHLVLSSRSGEASPENEQALAALRETRAEVVLARADVGDEADLERCLGDLRSTMPPLRGVVHGAMVLDDVLLSRMAPEQLRSVMAPKVAGAWNLHRLTAGDELDFFVMFSSIASLFGTVGQGSYAAANLFLDALSPYRRSLGLPSLTINWGALGEVGYVSRHEEVGRHLERHGVLPVEPSEAMDVLEQTLRLGFSNVTTARLKWDALTSLEQAIFKSSKRLSRFAVSGDTGAEATVAEGDLLPLLVEASSEQRVELLRARVGERVAEVLGMSGRHVDLDVPLDELGVDSLMAVELQTVLQRDVGVPFALTSLLEAATVRAIAARLLEDLDLSDAAVSRVEGPSGDDGEAKPSSEGAPEAVAGAEQRSTDTATVILGASTSALAPQGAEVAPRDPQIPASPPETEGPRSRKLPAQRADRMPPPEVVTGSVEWPRRLVALRATLRRLFALVARVDVEGLENLPRSGPLILASNHLSMLDPPLVFSLLSRRCVALATHELKKYPWLSWPLDLADTIYVRRGEADSEALERGMAVLREGAILGVAPEGTRSKTGALGKGHYGVAYLAAQAGAPVLPLALWGQERIPRNWRRARRSQVTVRFGVPQPAPPSDAGMEDLKHYAEGVMIRIARLLPAEYRGVYADAVDDEPWHELEVPAGG